MEANAYAAAASAGVVRHELAHEVGDVIYVAGEELHCFEALGDRPLGFLYVAPPRAV